MSNTRFSVIYYAQLVFLNFDSELGEKSKSVARIVWSKKAKRQGQ